MSNLEYQQMKIVFGENFMRTLFNDISKNNG